MACRTNDGGVICGGALALGGIPPFNVFVSEFSIAVAGIYAGKTWLMVFCLILLTIVLAGLSLMVLKTVLGKQPDNVEVGDVNKVSLVAMAILLLFMFIMGIHIAEPILQLLKVRSELYSDLNKCLLVKC